jgi:hypothetical protein
MNYKIATFYSFCLFSLFFVIACGAQNDSLRTDTAFIQQLIDDPLTEQIKEIYQKQKDLILYNSLNMDALLDMLKNAPDNDPCKVTDYLPDIDYAVEYFDNMCSHIQLVAAVTKKYPEIQNLDSDARVKIFYTSEPVNLQDVMIILDTRIIID